MSDERRRDRRFPLLIDLNWEGKSGKYEARTSDLSTGGCFVDTIGAASAGDIIKFKLQLPSGEWMEIEGVVTFASPRVGFGIRFTNLTDGNKKKLEWLVKAAEYQEDKSG